MHIQFLIGDNLDPVACDWIPQMPSYKTFVAGTNKHVSVAPNSNVLGSLSDQLFGSECIQERRGKEALPSEPFLTGNLMSEKPTGREATVNHKFDS